MQERVGAGKILVLDQVRHSGVHGRAEESRRDADDRGQDDDLRRVRGERQGGEGAEADEVGADHQRAARQPVDQRPREHADRERRQQVGDQEGGDPGRGVRPLVDVELECDERQPRAGPGSERREEEAAETGLAAQQPAPAAALGRMEAAHSLLR